MSWQHRQRGRWFRAPRGRADQPAGRHTLEYVARHQDTGMFPVGAAGRESLAQHRAGEPDRGDRYSPEQVSIAQGLRGNQVTHA